VKMGNMGVGIGHKIRIITIEIISKEKNNNT
jgi:hypothetical protein